MGLKSVYYWLANLIVDMTVFAIVYIILCTFYVVSIKYNLDHDMYAILAL